MTSRNLGSCALVNRGFTIRTTAGRSLGFVESWVSRQERLSRSQHSSEQQPARDKETLSTMSAVDMEPAAPPALADRVAMVRAQLEPIRSRHALLDSYRRESLCRLATISPAVGSAAEVLDLAYAQRWQELEPETSPSDPLADLLNGWVDE